MPSKRQPAARRKPAKKPARPAANPYPNGIPSGPPVVPGTPLTPPPSPAAQANPNPPLLGIDNGALVFGRVASSLQQRTQSWLIPDLIPAATLTLIVGEPTSGKSTLGAWILSKATRAVVLPGHEEDLERQFLPRLQANDADPRRVLLADARPWVLPFDRTQLTRIVKDWQADLLWIDPIDSYIGDQSENDGQAVRAALESLTRLAQETGAAVVMARHPGKAAGNVCPGSRQWRTVPRLGWKLTVYEGPPRRYVLSLFKDSLSLCAGPRLYSLEKTPAGPPRFALGNDLDPKEQVALEVGDGQERRVLDAATELLKFLLAAGPMASSRIFAHAEQERISERHLRRAAYRLGVHFHREGAGAEHKSTWSLPGQGGCPTVAWPESTGGERK